MWLCVRPCVLLLEDLAKESSRALHFAHRARRDARRELLLALSGRRSACARRDDATVNLLVCAPHLELRRIL